MKNRIYKSLIVAALSSTIASGVAMAQSNQTFAIGPKIGLSGVGLEGRMKIADQLYSRLGVNYFQYTNNYDNYGVKWKGKLQLLTVPLMLDFHPFADSGFRISVGAAYNNNHISLKAKPSSSLTFRYDDNDDDDDDYGYYNDYSYYDYYNNYGSETQETFSPSEIGSLKGKLKFGNKIAPIVSIGYDSSLISESSWSFNGELGLMYAGKPKLSVSSSGLVGDLTRLALLHTGVIDNAKRSLKKTSKLLRYYPIISLGFKYSF